MPFLVSKVNIPISSKQEQELKARLGKAIGLIPGKSEDAIGGLPINMEGFRLFDPEHRSSKPLSLAYKAAQIVEPEKADTFLLNLRHATVLDCRPTTHEEEILAVVRASGIEDTAFLSAFHDGRAEAALEQDLAFIRSLGIHSFPAYLIQRQDKTLFLQSFEYNDFVKAVETLRILN